MLLWRICSRLLVLVYILLKWLQIFEKKIVPAFSLKDRLTQVQAADREPCWPGRGSRRPGPRPAPVHPQSLGRNSRSSELAGRHLCAHHRDKLISREQMSAARRRSCARLYFEAHSCPLSKKKNTIYVCNICKYISWFTEKSSNNEIQRQLATYTLSLELQLAGFFMQAIYSSIIFFKLD